MHRTVFLLVLFLLLPLLNGCLYPEDRRQQLDALPQHVQSVQAEVEHYQKQNQGIFPYRYVEDERKLTTKYVVDFRLLSPDGGKIPPTAFEKGGYYLYVYTHTEEKTPLVRVFDLRISDQVEKIQAMVQGYKKEHGGELPIKEKVTEQYGIVDLEKINMPDLVIPSPYHGESHLPILLDSQGQVYLDYRSEVMRMIERSQVKPKTGENLQNWITKNQLVVPAYSPPMHLNKKGEPVFPE